MIKHCGELIREKRNVLKLSQEKLAEALGVSVTTIGRLERGQIKPSAWMICEIAKWIGIPIKDFCPPLADAENVTFAMEDETITVSVILP